MIDMQTVPQEILMLMALTNFAVCSAVGWACVCRFSVMSESSTKVDFRLGYTLLFSAATASGLGPWLWGEWPGPGQIAMSLAALFVIGRGLRNWRAGPPDYARSGPVPLEESAWPGIAGGGK